MGYIKEKTEAFAAPPSRYSNVSCEREHAMSTLKERPGATPKLRQTWQDAIQRQAKFLHDLLDDGMVSIQVEGMKEGTWGGSLFFVREGKRSWTENFLREWPRNKYEIRYECYSLVPDLYLNERGMLAWRKKKVTHASGLLPHTYDFAASFYEKRPLCDCIVLPDGRTTRADTEAVTSSEIRTSLKKILKKYPDCFVRRWIRTVVKHGHRGEIIYRVAKMLADAGASADEIECAVRASEAFKSKSAPFHLDGQGRRWGEQEIQRMRRLAR
jgi:hypothetical protein